MERGNYITNGVAFRFVSSTFISYVTTSRLYLRMVFSKYNYHNMQELAKKTQIICTYTSAMATVYVQSSSLVYFNKRSQDAQFTIPGGFKIKRIATNLQFITIIQKIHLTSYFDIKKFRKVTYTAHSIR